MFVHDLKEGGRAGCICSNHRLQVTGTIQLTPAYVGCESGTACKVVTPDPYCYSGQYGHRVTVQDNVKAEALSQGRIQFIRHLPAFGLHGGRWSMGEECGDSKCRESPVGHSSCNPTSHQRKVGRQRGAQLPHSRVDLASLVTKGAEVGDRRCDPPNLLSSGSGRHLTSN
ncbi:unnamed protein product [Cutaneotrichosporon oleaginosum]